MKIGKRDSLVRVLSLQTDWEKRDTVYLVNYGFVSGKSEIKFLSNDPYLVFKMKPSDKDSFMLSITDFETGMPGSSFMDFPDLKEKPIQYSEFVIADVKEFQIILHKVLNDYFPAGTYPTQQDNVITTVTPFRRLKLPDVNLIGEISLFISHPIARGTGNAFHISYLARECRRTSPRWRQPGNEVKDSANAFFIDFIKKVRK